MSVRTRIAVVAALLAGIALAGAGSAVYLVQSRRLDDHVNSTISVEMAEFANLEKTGIDASTGRPFTTSTQLMRSALQSHLPEANEVLIAFWRGAPRLGQGDNSRELSNYGPFVDAVNQASSGGGTFRLDTPLGPTVVAVRAVHDRRLNGAYVVAHFLDPERAALWSVMRTYALVAGVALLLVTVGAWIVASRLLRPLRHLRETAQGINDSDLSRRIPTTGNDDITELAQTFNSMLDRLQTSFANNRQFLDDAGHELRTPITIIRGHLEVVNPDKPADVAATRALVLDEIDRMARMVDDLMVLSRADQPDFIRLEETDAGVLTDDVLDKVRALGDRDWRLDARAQGSVLADPQRITQALLQLTKNAIAHTNCGDEIAIGSRHDGNRASWWVRDAGTGIEAMDTERIFERFQRGEQASRVDGSGLGLSIVTAIMRAHHGEVSVKSEPGVGSIFTLTVFNGPAHV
jgi:signal transduction histidine kinase